MVDRHIAYYLGSKIAAAIINVLTLAIFVRLGGAETYGAYMIALALAYLTYGLTLQWLRFSFFASYKETASASWVTAYLLVLAAGLAVLAILALIAVLAGISPAAETAAVVLLVVALASYDALHEIARTRLEAGVVAAGVMVRALLMLVLGSAALTLVGTPLALAAGVALAHFGAAAALFSTLRGRVEPTWSADAAWRLWRYGRPLIPAYGLDAVGLQFDRLLMARYASLSDTGSYGAVADFIRQSMIVVSEAIAGAYMPLARSHAVAGRQKEAGDVLGQAFLALVALGTFGAAFILRFQTFIFHALFGATVSEAVEPAVPLLVAATIAAIFRGYYFGSVLHITRDSRLSLVSNGVSAAAVAVTGVFLVPAYGMVGAAGALLAGHVSGCVPYVWAWRDSFVMKLPYTEALGIVGAGTSVYIVTGGLQQSFGTGFDIFVANGLLFGATAVFTASYFDLLSFNRLSLRAWRLVVPERTKT